MPIAIKRVYPYICVASNQWDIMGIKGFKRKDKAASDVLEDAVRHYQTDMITLGEVMHALHERGFGLLLIIFVLPNCVPIPAPGVTSLTAIPLIFFGWQLLMGRESPWLPNWISRKQIRRTLLAKMVQSAAPRMKKIEKLLRARLSFASSDTGEKIIGGLVILFASSIALPLPWTNFIPGVGILIMSLGLLSRDGVVILIGAVIGTIGITTTIGVLIFGHKAIAMLFG